MSRKLAKYVGGDFVAVPFGHRSAFDNPWTGNPFLVAGSGWRITETIILTAAHNFIDVRVDSIGDFYSEFAISYGTLAKNGNIASASLHFHPNTIAHLEILYSAGIHPYTASTDTGSQFGVSDMAFLATSSSNSVNDLMGVSVFYGESSSNSDLLTSTFVMHSMQGGSYHKISYSLAGISTGYTTLHLDGVAIVGDSGSGITSDFRTLYGEETLHAIEHSTHSQTTFANFVSASFLEMIYAADTTPRIGEQNAQPRDYRHGSDLGDSIWGSYRPDVIYGNDGEDFIEDGDSQSFDHWADDMLSGGAGNDSFLVGGGNNLIHGGVWDNFDATYDPSIDIYDIASFASDQGIRIFVGGDPVDSTYADIAGFADAVFVETFGGRFVNTVIGVETFYGTEFQDTLTVSSFAALDALLSNGAIDFDQGPGQQDILDLSGITTSSVFVNLSDNAFDFSSVQWQPYGYADQFSALVLNPNSVTDNSTGEEYSLHGFNAIQGANYTDSTFDSWDVFVGSDEADIFYVSDGVEIYVLGDGDLVTRPSLVGVDRDDITSVPNTPDVTFIIFNGIELGNFVKEEDVPYVSGKQYSSEEMSGWYRAYDQPFRVYADFTISEVTVYDTRDGSSFTITGFTGDLNLGYNFSYSAAAQTMSVESAFRASGESVPENIEGGHQPILQAACWEDLQVAYVL